MYFLIIPMVLAFAVENILWKRNRLKPLTSLIGNAIWRFVFVMSVFLVFLAIMGDGVFDGLTWGVVGLTFTLHIFGVSAVMLWVKTMQNLCVSIAEPLSLFRIIPLTLLSWVIFGGRLTVWEILLVTLIFLLCGSLGFFQGRTEADKGCFKKGVCYIALWTCCVVSMDLIINHMSYTGVHPITFSALRAITFLMVASTVFLIFKRGGRITAIKTVLRNKIMIAIGAIFAVHSILFITLLLHIDNVGILTAIGVASVPLVVLWGVVFMRDRLRWYSFVFIAMIVACVAALTIIST
ncbi:MAG: hypothetical protein FWE38_03880 [Firmicutes bacterium]|nr:hypothetical protein [Bacillota bacterium]